MTVKCVSTAGLMQDDYVALTKQRRRTTSTRNRRTLQTDTSCADVIFLRRLGNGFISRQEHLVDQVESGKDGRSRVCKLPALDSTMAATGVAAMMSSSQRSYRRSSGDAGTRYAAHALPVSCVHIVACISPICDYECVTPTGNTHDHAGPCFITNER